MGFSGGTSPFPNNIIKYLFFYITSLLYLSSSFTRFCRSTQSMAHAKRIVEHSPTCCRHGRKSDMSCVMSAPSATHFCTMSATCHLTCRRHVGSDISCLSFWGSGRHADIRHLPTKVSLRSGTGRCGIICPPDRKLQPLSYPRGATYHPPTALTAVPCVP